MSLPMPIVLEGFRTVLFMCNWSVSRVLEAATWRSNPVFTSFYLRDVALIFDGFRALGPVVAAGSCYFLMYGRWFLFFSSSPRRYYLGVGRLRTPGTSRACRMGATRIWTEPSDCLDDT